MSAHLTHFKKIAVLRANALGDFLFTLPALHALRTTYPAAEIVYLGKVWHTTFVPGHVPDIDRVIAVPPYPGVGEPAHTPLPTANTSAFFSAMQKERFDLALQLHGGGRHSNPFLLQLGAAYTVGLRTPDAAELDVSIPYVFYQNEILRLLEVVSTVNATTARIAPQITVLTGDRREAQAVVAGRTPYVVIHPGASDSRRHWAARNFSKIARALLACNYTVFVTGSPAEQKIIDTVVQGAQGAVSLCGQLSLHGLTGLLADATLLVSNDTGPLHLASAVGTKTVGIFWIGNALIAGHTTYAGHRPHISWTTSCPVCGTSCVTSTYAFDHNACAHQVSFVNDVQATDVLNSCYELLGLNYGSSS